MRLAGLSLRSQRSLQSESPLFLTTYDMCSESPGGEIQYSTCSNSPRTMRPAEPTRPTILS